MDRDKRVPKLLLYLNLSTNLRMVVNKKEILKGRVNMDNGSKSNSAKSLSLFGFFAITASMLMASYKYPKFATFGFTLDFTY